jgi:hypothetical protein
VNSKSVIIFLSLSEGNEVPLAVIQPSVGLFLPLSDGDGLSQKEFGRSQ